SAAGLVYFLNDDGVMNVVKVGPVFTRIARSELGEKTFASPALSQNRLYLRGDQHLFCIAEP
ncbi:MAG TPA: serine/threonine protein kinase, partial [Verrucomicrobiae bacterium]|nr:serine/threonine protein kinase [Verrucomicrobiae bacterium]